MKAWKVVLVTIFFYLFTSFAANACPDMLSVSPGDDIPCNGFFINETRTEEFLKLAQDVDKLEKDLLNQQGINYLILEENRLMGEKVDRCEKFTKDFERTCNRDEAWSNIKFMGIGISIGVVLYAVFGQR